MTDVSPPWPSKGLPSDVGSVDGSSDCGCNSGAGGGGAGTVVRAGAPGTYNGCGMTVGGDTGNNGRSGDIGDNGGGDGGLVV